MNWVRAPNGICHRFLGLSNRSGTAQGFEGCGRKRVERCEKAELMGLAREHLSPAQLEDATPGRSYKLTAAGWALLDAHPEVVVKHPKKG